MGSAVPVLTVTNEELTSFLDTSDEWIASRTGIRERHILSTETLEDLAAKAAEKAIADAKLLPQDIDYILCSNVYNSYLTPGLGCLVQGRIQATCPSLDLNGACAGFLYALEMGQGLLKSKCYRHILVIAAEATSRFADWTDRSTCVLFGDAAAAAVITAEGDDALFRMTTVSNAEYLFAKNPAGNCPYMLCAPEPRMLYMNGQEVYKFAVSTATKDIQALLQESGLHAENDVALYVLHQANLRIVEGVRARFHLPEEKFPVNIDKYGNTSSASIPLLLDELHRHQRLKRGESIILAAFGAGLTAGAALMRW